MRDEITITLRRDELQSVIVALTQHFDRTSNTFEEIAARYAEWEITGPGEVRRPGGVVPHGRAAG